MASYLITGANRGLGFGLCSALAAKDPSEVSIVFAAARNESDALKELASKSSGRVKIVPMVVTEEDNVKKAVGVVEQALGDKGLDVLVNVAGVMPFTFEGIQAMDDLESTFAINVTSVHSVTRAFLPMLKKGNLKKIFNITSTVGSIAMAESFKNLPTPAYKITKAALNMLTVQYSLALADEGFTVAAVSPGYLKTDMGGDGAHLDVKTGVDATLDIILRNKKEDNGKLLDINVPGWNEGNPELRQYEHQYTGQPQPW